MSQNKEHLLLRAWKENLELSHNESASYLVKCHHHRCMPDMSSTKHDANKTFLSQASSTVKEMKLFPTWINIYQLISCLCICTITCYYSVEKYGNTWGGQLWPRHQLNQNVPGDLLCTGGGAAHHLHVDVVGAAAHQLVPADGLQPDLHTGHWPQHTHQQHQHQHCVSSLHRFTACCIH